MIEKRYQHLAELRSELISTHLQQTEMRKKDKDGEFKSHWIPEIFFIMHDMRIREMEKFLRLKR